jgi:Flp pilus assembly protein TadD
LLGTIRWNASHRGLMRPNMRPRKTRAAHLIASATVAGLMALSTAGCKTTGDDTTGSLSATGGPTSQAAYRSELATLGPRYKSNPSDAKTAIAYARALRAIGQRAQAVAVLQQCSMRNPHDMALLGEYGRALADAGEYPEALDALTRATTPDSPDWRILNAQGAVLDQMGRHVEAQRHYMAALNLVPNDPSVLSNLGLSYALEKNLPRAEATLRKAVAQPGAAPKVRQNLALVVGLQGRFSEAERIASADLPASEAEANVAYLRQMLAQRDAWKQGAKEPYVPPPDPGS